MEIPAWHNIWRDVDSTEDPGFFIRFLDETRVRNMQMIEADAAAYFGYLEPKPGQTILDVGCGTGALLHKLAGLVSPGGRVVGIDNSTAMIEEARRRAPADVPLEFQVVDAYNMPFADGTFDTAMSHIVFQHLPSPELPLAEMVRVTKPGGRIVLTEQVWDTFFFDCGEKDVTRRVMQAFCDMIPNGNIGRELLRMFKEAGLERVTALPIPMLAYGEEVHVFDVMIRSHLRNCLAAEIVSSAEHDSWIQSYEERVSGGMMTTGFLSVRATGFKS